MGARHDIRVEVFRRFCQTLEEADSSGRLRAFAYSWNNFEKWLVCETYFRLCRDWKMIVPSQRDKDWDAWMEVVQPKQERPRRHIDLFLGAAEPFPPDPRYEQPTADTPVFEFKMVRDDNWPEGKGGLVKDAEKLLYAGLRNGCLLVVFRARDKGRLSAMCDELDAAVSNVEPLPGSSQWGPRCADLTEWDEGKVWFLGRGYQVVARRT